MVNIVYPIALIASLITSSSASSFANTSPLLIVSDNDINNDLQLNNKIEIFNKIDNSINSLTKNICNNNNENDNDNSILYLRIHGLKESDLDNSQFISNFNNNNNNNNNNIITLSNNVVYDNENNNNYLNIHQSCGSINQLDIYNINEINTIINNINDASFIIIQGLPNTHIKSFNSNKESEKVLHYSKSSHKREEEINYQEIESQLEESFNSINELFNEDLDHDTVSIYSKSKSNSESKSKSSTSTPVKVINGSLFDKYSFFTNGIWMCTIVFLFLAWIVTVALSWLNSMQISYGSFDKPFDFEKKLQ